MLTKVVNFEANNYLQFLQIKSLIDSYNKYLKCFERFWSEVVRKYGGTPRRKYPKYKKIYIKRKC